MEIDLLDLLSFEINNDIKEIFDLGTDRIFSIIEPIDGLSFEESLHSRWGTGSNKFAQLILLNQTIYSYFINEHLYGIEFLNWTKRTSYIQENEAIYKFYKNRQVMDYGLDEVLRYYNENNIRVKLTHSDDDPNYLRISCEKYERSNDWDQLLIFHKGDNRIDYFLVNNKYIYNR